MPFSLNPAETPENTGRSTHLYLYTAPPDYTHIIGVYRPQRSLLPKARLLIFVGNSGSYFYYLYHLHMPVPGSECRRRLTVLSWSIYPNIILCWPRRRRSRPQINYIIYLIVPLWAYLLISYGSPPTLKASQILGCRLRLSCRTGIRCHIRMSIFIARLLWSYVRMISLRNMPDVIILPAAPIRLKVYYLI